MRVQLVPAQVELLKESVASDDFNQAVHVAVCKLSLDEAELLKVAVQTHLVEHLLHDVGVGAALD